MADQKPIPGLPNLKGNLIYLNVHTEQKGEPEKWEFRVTKLSKTQSAMQVSLFNTQRDQLFKLMTTDPKTVIPNHQMSMAVIYNVLLKSLVGDAENVSTTMSNNEELVIKAAPTLKIFGATLKCEFVYKFSVAKISETEYVKVKFLGIERRLSDLKNDLHKRVERENDISKRLKAIEGQVDEFNGFAKYKQRLQGVEERLDELTAISDHKQLEVVEAQSVKIVAQFDTWHTPYVPVMDNFTKFHTKKQVTIPVSFILNNEEAIRCRFQVLDFSTNYDYMFGVIANSFSKYEGYPEARGHGWVIYYYPSAITQHYCRNGTDKIESNYPRPEIGTNSIVAIDFLPKEKQIKFFVDGKHSASIIGCTFNANSYKFSVSTRVGGITIRVLSLKRL